MNSAEHQRHMMDTLVEARAAHERRRDRITLVAVVVLIGALFVLGAALAGSQ